MASMGLEPMGIFRRFTHNVLGWHTPTDIIGFDGASATSTCRYCHASILQDSQGGWFPATAQSCRSYSRGLNTDACQNCGGTEASHYDIGE